MTTKPDYQKTCRVCNQQFNSDRELQEHQNKTHSRPTSEKQPTHEQNYGSDQGDRKKSA